MIAVKKPPPPPKILRVSVGTTPRSGAGTPPSAKPDPALHSQRKLHRDCLPPPVPIDPKAFPRAPASSLSAPAAVAKKDPPSGKESGRGGPKPLAGLPPRPEGYPVLWYNVSWGTSEPNVYTIRRNELPGLKNIAPLNADGFKFAKRISGLLRDYEHTDLQPHHRHIPPDFNADLCLNFEGVYTFLKKCFRYYLSRDNLCLILKTQDRLICMIEAGQLDQFTTMGMPFRITHGQTLIEKVGTYPLVKTIIRWVLIRMLRI